jgi:Dihydroxyacid dehydratase/phosphogluconate dehydratase
MSDKNTRTFSSLVVDGMERAPSRAMLHAVGFSNADFKKPQIGIASTWSMVTPCNMHINKLADAAAVGVNNADGKAVVFNTITISDGISMGTEGMKYSLVSREVIADSIETVVGCQGFDGIVAIGGCDKNMPGCMMAIARLNRPAVFVYGGTILPGCHKDKNWMWFQCSKRSVPEPTTRSTMPSWLKSKPKLYRAQVLAAACIPPIPWLRPLKPWA